MNLDEAAELSHADWQQRAADLKKSAETRLFIGGKFVDAVEGGTFENVCPVDGSVMNICAAGTEADIDRSIGGQSQFEQVARFASIKTTIGEMRYVGFTST